MKHKIKQLKTIALVAFFLSFANVYAVKYGEIDWLVPSDADIDSLWLITRQDEKIVFYPKWGIHKKNKKKRILGVVYENTPRFQMAIYTLLENLYKRNMFALLEVYNYKKNSALGNRLVEYAEKSGVDLIYAVGTDTADFFYREYNGGRIPVVTVMNRDPVLMGWIKDYENSGGANIAATSSNTHPEILRQYIFELMPGIRNILLIHGDRFKHMKANEIDLMRKMYVKNTSNERVNVFDLVVNKENATSELRVRLPSIVNEMVKHDRTMKKSIILVMDSAETQKSINLISDMGRNIPIIALQLDMVKGGAGSALLAIGVEHKNNANIAAEYSIEILSGLLKPSELTVGMVVPPDIAVNFMIAKKINFRIPFQHIENASHIYNYVGKNTRKHGIDLENPLQYGQN